MLQGNNPPNPLFLLDESTREKVVEIVKRTANQFAFSEPDIQTMFDAFEAMTGEKEKITCGACRVKVVGRLRMYVQKL